MSTEPDRCGRWEKIIIELKTINVIKIKVKIEMKATCKLTNKINMFVFDLAASRCIFSWRNYGTQQNRNLEPYPLKFDGWM